MYFWYVIEAVSWRPEENEVARNHHGVQFAKLYLYVLSCDDRRGTKFCETNTDFTTIYIFGPSTCQVKCYILSETHLCGTWDRYTVNATTEDEVGQVPKKVSRTQEAGEKGHTRTEISFEETQKQMEAAARSINFSTSAIWKMWKSRFQKEVRPASQPVQAGSMFLRW